MQENDYLFTQENGERLNPSTYTGWLNKVLKSAGLDHHSLHSLRHTNITMQIAAGVPLVTVSARAGHARTSTTSDIYAHFIKSSDKTAAEVIDNLFNAKEPEVQIDPPTATENIASVERTAESNECTKDENADTEEFKILDTFRKVKEEMKRLGFETLAEYEEYLDFIEFQKQKRANKNKDFEM